MIAQSVFSVNGPAEVSGDSFSTNQGDLGSNDQKYRNLYLTGTGNADTFSSRSVEAVEGQITGLSVSNLYPVSQPDLGHPNAKWNDLHITGTGYGYSFKVPYSTGIGELITREEVLGQVLDRFSAKYLTTTHTVQFVSGIVTGLSFDLLANKTYKIEYNLQYSGDAATEGISIALSGTNPAVFVAGESFINDNNSTPEAFVMNGYLTEARHIHGASSARPILMNTLIVNSTTNSTVYLIAGKESAGANLVYFRSGSWAVSTQY